MYNDSSDVFTCFLMLHSLKITYVSPVVTRTTMISGHFVFQIRTHSPLDCGTICLGIKFRPDSAGWSDSRRYRIRAKSLT